MKYHAPTTPTGRSAKPEKTSESAYLIGIFAILVGITPEFTFMGIPKVRLTDLLLPFILMTCGGKTGSGPKIGGPAPLVELFKKLMLWNLGCLFIWGQAPLSPGIFYLGKRLVYGLIAYSAYAAVQTIPSWNRVIRLMVFASPILSFSVLHELNTNIESGGILATSEGMRASGIIANQETSTALYIAVITCISLGAWSAFRDPLWRIGTTISLVAGCAAIMATGSRGGLACIVLAVLITALQHRKRGMSLVLGAAIVGAIGWQFTPPELQERLAGIFPETTATIEAYTMDDAAALDIGGSSIADRALGAQITMQTLIPQSGIFGLGTAFKRLGAIDDFYLTEWVYHGLIGLGLFISLQVSMVKTCQKRARVAQDPAEQGVAASAVTAVIVMSASGIHADTFYLIRPMEALALLLGLVAARQKMNAYQSDSVMARLATGRGPSAKPRFEASARA